MPFKVTCTPISSEEYEQLRTGARILMDDPRGEKVLLTPDQHIIKLFYPRHRISSAHLYPYAFRFWKNAIALREKGITTVQCEQLRYERERGRHLITYPLLPGKNIRDCIRETGHGENILPRLADYLAYVHDKGILFRSIHLGNILVLDDGGFGLIDIADLSVQRRPLGLVKRARNFRHLLHDKVDRDSLEQYGY